MGDPTSALIQYGPWAVVVYILAKEVLPLVAPGLVKSWSKRVTTEERLFKLLERSIDGDQKLAETLAGLKHAVEGLGGTLIRLDSRVTQIEQDLQGTSELIAWFRSLPAFKEQSRKHD